MKPSKNEMCRLDFLPEQYGGHKKQGGVSLSTTEAEFVAASEVARELLGIREMLYKIGAVPKQSMLMHMENQSAIRQLEDEASSLKAKQIDVRVKFVCDFARRGIVLAQTCDSNTVPAQGTRRDQACKVACLIRVG
ncbi:unnamed protein product [Peronospora belbahrii]|uniref:Uncharacterized protein n=1 Tax=Peronospora belbahrii TaxID=622444 RepID=A0AAU9KPK9_9STRA|nr:unnamed protein product [Peronospora belbahrii]CAH0519777.1 unnamed protein product [Peronospora belbahrii]